MDDAQLIAAERAAYAKAQSCPVYTGDETYHAVRSGGRSAAAADEWMRLRDQMIMRGLAKGATHD